MTADKMGHSGSTLRLEVKSCNQEEVPLVHVQTFPINMRNSTHGHHTHYNTAHTMILLRDARPHNCSSARQRRQAPCKIEHSTSDHEQLSTATHHGGNNKKRNDVAIIVAPGDQPCAAQQCAAQQVANAKLTTTRCATHDCAQQCV